MSTTELTAKNQLEASIKNIEQLLFQKLIYYFCQNSENKTFIQRNDKKSFDISLKLIINTNVIFFLLY